MNIGAKVYRMALNSSASHGDTDLAWIHSGEEVVRHSDYEIALKRILELEDKLELEELAADVAAHDICDYRNKCNKLKEQVRVRGERMETLWSNVYVAIMSQDSYDNISKWFDDNGKVRDD